jgi:hypothetical protein
MSNRVIRKDGYCKLLLLPNKGRGLTDEYYCLVSSEDYPKVKKYDWRVYKIGSRLQAATYVGRDFTIITKLLFPNIKRIHRINNDSLDNRRFNIKHFNNETVSKTIKKEKQESLEVKEETMMIDITQSNYGILESIKLEKGFEDQNQSITYLIDSHNILHAPTMVIKEETGKISFWNSFKERMKALL